MDTLTAVNQQIDPDVLCKKGPLITAAALVVLLSLSCSTPLIPSMQVSSSFSTVVFAVAFAFFALKCHARGGWWPYLIIPVIICSSCSLVTNGFLPDKKKKVR